LVEKDWKLRLQDGKGLAAASLEGKEEPENLEHVGEKIKEVEG
jgi:hypothetical protein